ncbi:hypothetical protein E2C01_042235 [Portunus trituberculatus]|uniref:Uncharacterized protein n=1 Tax=Portunus trituberculatus TaxID=210409 RepID=A0A5B7FPN3_PORTR|nr:hypothetical protein [Portunus trituberculatus]
MQLARSLELSARKWRQKITGDTIFQRLVCLVREPECVPGVTQGGVGQYICTILATHHNHSKETVARCPLPLGPWTGFEPVRLETQFSKPSQLKLRSARIPPVSRTGFFCCCSWAHFVRFTDALALSFPLKLPLSVRTFALRSHFRSPLLLRTVADPRTVADLFAEHFAGVFRRHPAARAHVTARQWNFLA